MKRGRDSSVALQQQFPCVLNRPRCGKRTLRDRHSIVAPVRARFWARIAGAFWITYLTLIAGVVGHAVS
jgi:hypothetical protein